MYFKLKYKRISSLLIIMCLSIGFFNNTLSKSVSAAEGDWIIIDPSDSDKKVMTNYISWLQTHSSGENSSVRYRTQYFYVSRTPYLTNELFTSSNNSAISKYKVNFTMVDIDTSSTTKTREYQISRTDLLAAAKSLGITPEQLRASGSAGVPIYLNPVYGIYTGDYDNPKYLSGLSNVFGLQEMLSYNWSAETRNNLKNFYNKEYRLTTSNLYPVEVIMVDTQKNKLLDIVNSNYAPYENPLYKSEAYYGASITYQIRSGDLEVQAKLTSGEKRKEYKYTNTYYYEYKDKSGKSVVSSYNTGDYINIGNAPDVGQNSKLTIYVIYETKAGEPYKVDIIAEDENKKEIQAIASNLDTKGGAKFEFTVGSQRYEIEKSGIKYNYQHKYYLTYTDEDGNKKTTETVNGTNINYIMPNVKKGTKAKFHLIYGTQPGPTPTPNPLPEIIVPEPDYHSMPYTSVTASGSILADDKGANKFVSVLGVPTTESLYGEATATEYIIGYSFTKHVGIKHFNIKVKKDYILKWQEATPVEELPEGEEPIVYTETVTIEKIYSVPRAYGYWEIDHLGFYTIDNVRLNNYALPNGTITITPNYSYYNPPSMSVRHYSGIDGHVIKPDDIVLPSMEIDGGINKPAVPDEDFEHIALSQTGKAKVKNDYVSWNGIIVMSDTVVETEGVNIDKNAIQQCYSVTRDRTLYKNNQIIEATKLNGEYVSNGNITYTAKASVNRPSYLSYGLNGVNKVTIHTPVVCIPTITANNDNWVQLINPEPNAIHLVIDEDPTLNDFTVKISNNGYHSAKLGYYTRDFAWGLRNPSESYIAKAGNGLLRNEVRFPFDVYRDIGDDFDTSNDKYVKAGTWITIGHTKPRFYIPMWVNEGVYDVEFRTVAVNGANKLNYTEPIKNTDLNNYVATDIIKVQVSGRIYGLTMYDVSDYPMWKTIFRAPKSTRLKINYPSIYQDGTKLNPNMSEKPYNANYSYYYTVGTNDQYGNDMKRNNKYTFPMVNGSHPRYNNLGILKTGYLTRFKLQTTGEMISDASKVIIEPTFYFVDKNGKNRQPVDIYYTEEIKSKSQNLVKIGSSLDLTNIKSFEIGNIQLSIPEEEVRQTAAIKGEKYGTYIWKKGAMFNFSKITLQNHFKTFVNDKYTTKINAHISAQDVKDAGITNANITSRKQNWYGQYYLPNIMYAAPKGYDVLGYADKYGIRYNESFWLKDGYIIVNFNIYTVDTDGNRNLSYTNLNNSSLYGHCNMWDLENPPIDKINATKDKIKFTFMPGDYVIYYADQRASDDYKTGPAW